MSIKLPAVDYEIKRDCVSNIQMDFRYNSNNKSYFLTTFCLKKPFTLNKCVFSHTWCMTKNMWVVPSSRYEASLETWHLYMYVYIYI